MPRPWLVQRSALQKADRKVEMSQSLGNHKLHNYTLNSEIIDNHSSAVLRCIPSPFFTSLFWDRVSLSCPRMAMDSVVQTDLALSMPLPQPPKELESQACTTRSSSNLLLKQVAFVCGTAFTYLVSALSTCDLAGIAHASLKVSYKLRCPFSVQEEDLFLILGCALESLGQLLKKDAVVCLSPNLDHLS